MNWSKIASAILRFRILILIVITGLTVLMAYQSSKLQMDYGYSGMVPDSDSISINLEEFRKTFGGDANIIIVGIEDDNFFELSKFKDWQEMRDKILNVEGVESAFSAADAVEMAKERSGQKFKISQIFAKEGMSGSELAKGRARLDDLPIYDNILYSKQENVYLMVLFMDPVIMNTKDRENIMNQIREVSGEWGNKYGVQLHYSGLPYIRSTLLIMIRAELLKFIYMAAVVAFLLMLLFFRSLKAVIPSVIVVGMGVLWAFGTMTLMDFKITVLTGMMPPLIIVIGVTNCVFFLNKYHLEYRKNANKIHAIKLSIEKVGSAVFLTNLTTAAGFATFMVINNKMLSNFGLISSINILILFVLSVLLIPIFLSFLPAPDERQLKHLDHNFTEKITGLFTNWILRRRRIIYILFGIAMGLSIWGVTKMETTGFILDDVPKTHPLSKDLEFFEDNLAGVMPLEFSIDTRKPNGVMRGQTLRQADLFQKKLSEYPELSRSLSIVDGLKFARQAYFNNDPDQYKLPSRQEQSFILRALDNDADKSYMLNMLVDSTRRIMRISVRVQDIGVRRMLELKDSLQKELDHHFPISNYDAKMTGSSLTFTLGTHYLVKNLFISLGLAIILISLFMAWMFSSLRMVLISIFPNLLPLLITAGIMGFFSISIRPSTILVFSIAFGISVDTAIHFLAKYRQELNNSSISINKAVINALKEVGVSIIYTVIILFFGFGIFVASEFGGTVAMGLLTAITLLVAMMANLLLVPSILLGINGKKKMNN